jgi:hypothetical protein
MAHNMKWLHTWFKRAKLLQTWQNGYWVMNIYNAARTYSLEVRRFVGHFDIFNKLIHM